MKRKLKVDPKKKRAKTGGRKPTLEAVAVSAAIAEYSGNLASVARQFKVTRSAVHQFVNASPALLQVVADQKESRLDNAESALDRALNEGEAWAVCFFLKTQGKKRGYVEKQEVEHSEKRKRLIIVDDRTVDTPEEVL